MSCHCQGEVEQIAMMKPKGQTEHDEGMLEYLEDIIGSCRLKEPINILCRRVELLNEQRGEKVRDHGQRKRSSAGVLSRFTYSSISQEIFLFVCFCFFLLFYFKHFGMEEKKSPQAIPFYITPFF